jgi:hypothetical protein
MMKLSKGLLAAVFLGGLLSLQALTAQACDKHPRGHQNSSETETDYGHKR